MSKSKPSKGKHDVLDHMSDDALEAPRAAAEEREMDADEAFSRHEADQVAHQSDITPSWFSPGYTPEDTEDLAARYREVHTGDPRLREPSPEAYEDYRRRLEERFQTAKRVAMAPAPMMSTMRHDEPPPRIASSAGDDGNLRFRDWQKKVQARQARQSVVQKPSPQPVRKGRLSPARIVGLFAGACTIGGLAGFASANVDSVLPWFESGKSAVGSGYEAVMAALPTWKEEKAPAGGGSTVLTKKPIKVTSVQVADASGGLNMPIPLDLAAVPANADIPIALKITGLPTDAYLTKGKEVSEGEWMLMSNEIAGVKLVVPQAQTPQLDLSVAAVEQATGTAAAPPREMTVELDLATTKVVPAGAPPEQQSITGQPLPQAVPLPLEQENSEARALFEKGEVLLKTGDLVTARQFFVKAHGLGLAEAAFQAGQTYDPLFYQKMNVRGLEPNRAKALEWYDKAAKAGSTDAAEALGKLSEVAAP